MLLNKFALFSSLSMSGVSELNNIGIVVAYSLRRLFLNYGGPLITVRRSNDNDEQDFTADGNGDLDTAALVAWVGAENHGYVVRWYDQSGGNYHAEQATQARQPQLVNSGAVLLEGGKPKLDFGAHRAVMNVTNNMHARLHAQNMPMATFSVQTLVNMTLNFDILLDIRRFDSYDSLFIAPSRHHNTTRMYAQKNAPGGAATAYMSNLDFPMAQALAAYLFDGTDAVMYSNNTAANPQNNYTVAGVPDYQVAYLGGWHYPNSGPIPTLHGSIQEFVLYNVDKSSDRAAIMANIMDYYGIS